jgi:hypothetical protein
MRHPLFPKVGTNFADKRRSYGQFSLGVTLVLKLSGTPQLLVYADDVNLLGDNMGTIKKNTEILMEACKKVGQ